LPRELDEPAIREQVDLAVGRVDPKSGSVAPAQRLKPVSLQGLPEPCAETSGGWAVPVQTSWFNDPFNDPLTIDLDGRQGRVRVRTVWVVISSESVCTTKLDARVPQGQYTVSQADPSETTLEDHPLPWPAESASLTMTIAAGPSRPKGSSHMWMSRWEARCRLDAWPR
jgi:hypothetical protein